MNKQTFLQLLVVLMLMSNLLTLDFSDGLSWASNKTNYINLFIAVVFLFALLLKEMPVDAQDKNKSSSKGQFKKKG